MMYAFHLINILIIVALTIAVVYKLPKLAGSLGGLSVVMTPIWALSALSIPDRFGSIAALVILLAAVASILWFSFAAMNAAPTVGARVTAKLLFYLFAGLTAFALIFSLFSFFLGAS